MVFGVVTNDIVLPFILPDGLRLNTKAYIKRQEEVDLTEPRRQLMEDLASGNKILRQATQSGQPLLGCEKIFANTSPLTSGCTTPKIAISLIIVYEARDQQNSVEHQRWTEGKDNDSIF